ncbi:MAG: hypothetical protein S4CHLAM6_08340 [Chlamydiae bacterium]|nr:hypothetical protein [Chlamydiota bacterium]
MDLRYLLEKAKSGLLEDSELAFVGKKLQQESKKEVPSDDLYTLIHIIGKADFQFEDGVTYCCEPKRAGQYRPILEKFLRDSKDPDIVSIALQSLCIYWDKSKHYLKEIKSFIEGVDWDEDQDLLMIAINIAGNYLNKTPNEELYQLLVKTLENDKKKDHYITECLVKAIAKSKKSV